MVAASIKDNQNNSKITAKSADVLPLGKKPSKTALPRGE